MVDSYKDLIAKINVYHLASKIFNLHNVYSLDEENLPVSFDSLQAIQSLG
jgi:hypothetical protein